MDWKPPTVPKTGSECDPTCTQTGHAYLCTAHKNAKTHYQWQDFISFFSSLRTLITHA